jgi:hypothetical protein
MVKGAVCEPEAGRWSICVQIELPDAEPVERPVKPVGIDLGPSAMVAPSNGHTVATPQLVKNAARSFDVPSGLANSQRQHQPGKAFA